MSNLFIPEEDMKILTQAVEQLNKTGSTLEPLNDKGNITQYGSHKTQSGCGCRRK